jgi:hypothetical protein
MNLKQKRAPRAQSALSMHPDSQLIEVWEPGCPTPIPSLATAEEAQVIVARARAGDFRHCQRGRHGCARPTLGLVE